MKNLFMVFALLTLFLTGCGDNDDNDSTPPVIATGTSFTISADPNTIVLTHAGTDPITLPVLMQQTIPIAKPIRRLNTAVVA